MARAGEACRSVLLAEIFVTASLERREGRGVYGDRDGDGDGGCHDTIQAGV